jgi:membrane protein required for colicin V production
MNILDIIIGVPIIWLAYRGFTKGFVVEVTTLIALVAGIYAAINFSYFTTDILQDYFTLENKYMSILSFAITFIVIVFLVVMIGRIIEKFIDLIALGFLDKLAGGLFGALKAALLISVILMILQSVDPGQHVISPKLKNGSILYGPVASVVPTILPMINLENFNVPFDNDDIHNGVKQLPHV